MAAPTREQVATAILAELNRRGGVVHVDALAAVKRATFTPSTPAWLWPVAFDRMREDGVVVFDGDYVRVVRKNRLAPEVRAKLPLERFAVPERRAWPLHDLSYAEKAIKALRARRYKSEDFERIARALTRWFPLPDIKKAVRELRARERLGMHSGKPATLADVRQKSRKNPTWRPERTRGQEQRLSAASLTNLQRENQDLPLGWTGALDQSDRPQYTHESGRAKVRDTMRSGHPERFQVLNLQDGQWIESLGQRKRAEALALAEKNLKHVSRWRWSPFRDNPAAKRSRKNTVLYGDVVDELRQLAVANGRSFKRIGAGLYTYGLFRIRTDSGPWTLLWGNEPLSTHRSMNAVAQEAERLNRQFAGIYRNAAGVWKVLEAYWRSGGRGYEPLSELAHEFGGPAGLGYALARLGTERQLERAGVRLTLGTATAAHRALDRIWVPAAGGDGTYYATYKLVRANSTTPRITVAETTKRFDHWRNDRHDPAYNYRIAEFYSVRIRQQRHGGTKVDLFEVTWYTGDPKQYWSSKTMSTLKEAVELANRVKPESDRNYAAGLGEDPAGKL